jgi:hypothetical protein
MFENSKKYLGDRHMLLMMRNEDRPIRLATICELPNSSLRAGITIMEVMFAIGVILTGLLGVVALIPVALRNAGESLRYDEAWQEANSVEAVLDGFNNLRDQLVIIADAPTDVAGVGSLSTSDPTVAGKRRTLANPRIHLPTPAPTPDQRLIHGAAMPAGAFPLPTGQVPNSPGIGRIDSPGYRRTEFFLPPLPNPLPTTPPNPIARAAIRHYAGFCIDPLGIAQGSLSLPNAYRAGVFPFFKPDWNILGSTTNSSDYLTHAMPRLWRCMLTRNETPGSPGFNIASNDIMDYATATAKFILPGNPSPKQVEDRSRAVARFFRPDGTLNRNPFVAGASDKYGWFATLVPSTAGANAYNLNTIIVERRLLEPLPVATTTLGPEVNRADERVGWVFNPLPGVNGSPGEISIAVSNDISDKVRVGSWVMLSKQRWRAEPWSSYDSSFTPVPAPPAAWPYQPDLNIPTEHKWFRVLAVNDSAPPSGGTLPSSSGGYWTKRLTLDQLVWDFTDLGNTNPEDDTICTLVNDAVFVSDATQISL